LKYNQIEIQKSSVCRGEVTLPGSKSIANRALMMSALSEGRTRLTGLPDSDDVLVMMKTLPLLGVKLEKIEEHAVQVHGCGGPFPVEKLYLNLDNAGTALRPMISVLSGGKGNYTVDGNDQMRKRPIFDLVNALQKNGVRISSSDGFPPVTIEADGLPGGLLEISGEVSSQFVSALLIAAPLSKSEVRIVLPGEPVSKPYIDLTLAMMKDFGVEAARKGYTEFTVQPGRYLSPGDYRIEGDASAATYFLAAGSLPGSGPVTVKGISKNSIQGDIRFSELLEKMGAVIEYGENSITAKGPGNSKKLKALDLDMNDMPDAAMTLAVISLFADGESHIRNIANLRVKESERISGLRKELEKLGARVVEEHDALHIMPPDKILSAEIDTYRDHRMAMAFSLAAFGTHIAINDPGCVSKTFPDYFDLFLPLLGE